MAIFTGTGLAIAAGLGAVAVATAGGITHYVDQLTDDIADETPRQLNDNAAQAMLVVGVGVGLYIVYRRA